MMLSEVDSVYSVDSFPFLHEERVFLTTLRSADVALRVNSSVLGHPLECLVKLVCSILCQ